MDTKRTIDLLFTDGNWTSWETPSLMNGPWLEAKPEAGALLIKHGQRVTAYPWRRVVQYEVVDEEVEAP